MIITTIENLGKSFEPLGMVRGSMVQSKHIGKDFMAGFKTVVGGELKGYTKMLEEAREISLKRMAEQASILGADAVVGVRFTSSSVMQGAAEVTAYGTAIRFIK